jgi:hypothetical protein
MLKNTWLQAQSTSVGYCTHCHILFIEKETTATTTSEKQIISLKIEKIQTMIQGMRLSYVISFILCYYWSYQKNVDAFVQSPRERSSVQVLLRDTNTKDESVDREKALRMEIVERNSKVEDEGQYAVLDGTGMNTETTRVVVEKEAATDSTILSSTEDESIGIEREKLERLIKKRPYALFLAEKAAEIVEDTVDGLFKSKNNNNNEVASSSSSPPSADGQREKVVVLGTGWGAAAFLKGIDTRLYDVTVISPRNYFVFTPMLAGASVGTVDYRSITEPIREVSNYLFIPCV